MWTQMELSRIFGINKPLNKDTAEEIWEEANETLKTLSVQGLLKKFKVEYIATTDDPYSPLENHGDIGGVKVRPTFRADARFKEGVKKAELEKRLDYLRNGVAKSRTTALILSTKRMKILRG